MNRILKQIEEALSEQNAYYDAGLSSSSLIIEQLNAAKAAAKHTSNLSYVEKIEYFLTTGEWKKDDKANVE